MAAATAVEPCNVLITGAWNPVRPQSPAALAQRRDRLRSSIAWYADLKASRRVVLADATLTDGDRAELGAEFPQLELPVLRTAPHGEWTGPSYLEALLYRAVAEAGVVRCDGERWIKATGGYRITNADAILAVARNANAAGIGFVHQHPLRPYARWVMSAFYLLDGRLLDALLRFAAGRAERARREPLEGLVRDFFVAQGRRRIRSPYPRIDAYYSTSGLRSDSPRLLLHTLSWRALSRLGLYAWCVPSAGAAAAQRAAAS
ncbi:MAG TPA: hypothetical protein VFU94_15245 [Conexibacter sp.]|nr:hypothetical protein [Conexibacter sp.]